MPSFLTLKDCVFRTSYCEIRKCPSEISSKREPCMGQVSVLALLMLLCVQLLNLIFWSNAEKIHIFFKDSSYFLRYIYIYIFLDSKLIVKIF